MDRSSQFAVPFVIIFIKFILFCIVSIPIFKHALDTPILWNLLLNSFLNFIYACAIILTLFICLNNGRTYSAKWIIWVSVIIFIVVQKQLTGTSYRYILKLFQELSISYSYDLSGDNPLDRLKFPIYMLIFYSVVFFILNIFIGPSAKANNIESDSRYYHIATSFVYSILTSAILYRLIDIILSGFINLNDENRSLLLSITLIMMSCIFLNTLVSAAACYQNLNTPQNRINIRKIITATTIYVLLVILLSYVIYLISTHLITQFGHFTSPEITMTGLVIFGFLCFLLVSYQIQKVILMKVFREQKVNQIVN